MKVAARSASVKGVSVARDANGKPKFSEDKAKKYWPMLCTEDRVFLKQKYSLNLEVGNG